MDTAEEKIKPPIKKLLDDWVAAHNKTWNITGIPWQNKRPGSSIESGRPVKEAKIITRCEEDPPDLMKLEEKKGKFIAFEVMGQKICITQDGEMWIWGQQDGEMTLDDGLTLIWGEFKIGEEATKLLQQTPLHVWHFAIQSADHEGGYATKVSTGDQAFHPVLSPLSNFLQHLEDKCDVQISDTPFACHKITATTKKDNAGDIIGREYTIQVESPCVFVPMPTPRKTAAGWGEAGSFLCTGDAAGQWDFETGLHIKGNLAFKNYLKYGNTEQHQGILPDKVAIYLEHPLKIIKGQLIHVA